MPPPHVKKGKKPLPAQRHCAYQGCKQLFAPRRPNQLYHSGNCRKFAHQQRLRKAYTGDAAARLVSVLKAVAAAPDQLYQSHDQMWAKILALGDRAADALKLWKAEMEDHQKK